MRTLVLIAPLALVLACADRTSSTADTTAGAEVTSTAAPSTTADTIPPARGMLDPNSATREQLLAAGVDTAGATILVTGRPFADMIAVDKALAGKMNAAQRKALYPLVWRPIDLNTAKGEEILLIPGVGARMRREFEEYRPYTSIEQFRREMGKYVDKSEVARLEQYITIK